MGWWWYYGSIMSNVNNGKKVSLVEENIRSVVEQTMMGGWPHWRTSPSYQRGVEIVHVSAMFVWKPNTSFSNFQQVRGATASTSFDRILFSPSCLVAFVDVSRRCRRRNLDPCDMESFMVRAGFPEVRMPNSSTWWKWCLNFPHLTSIISALLTFHMMGSVKSTYS